MNQVMDKIKNTKILGIVGNALLILGVMLPLIKVKYFGSFSLLSLEELGRRLGGTGMGFGVWLILIALLNFAIIFSDKIIAAVPSVPALEKLRNQKYTTGTTILAGALLIWNLMPLFEYGSLEIGFFVLILGLVAAIAYPFLYKGDANSNPTTNNFNQQNNNFNQQ